MRFPWKPWNRSKPQPASAQSTTRPTDDPASRLPNRPIRPEDWVGADEAENERKVRTGFVLAAKGHLARIPFAEDVVAMYFCLLDARTPLWVKGIVAAALAYFVLPLDAIPDVLPLIGMSDDITVLSTALAAISSHLTAEHRSRAASWLRNERIIDVTPASPR
jgi:uncharacterized membrane protein YkvA (DUF1232 family)